MKNKFTILGCGSSLGSPWITNYTGKLKKDFKNIRTRCCAHIYYKGLSLLIDTSPDIKYQFLKNKIQSLDAIMFTHEHADHTTGIDDVRPFFFRQGKIPIYLHERVLESLHEKFAYIFDPKQKYPGAPDFDVNLINKENDFELFGLNITPIESVHLRLPVLGFKIGNFAYLTDVKTISETELEKLKELDILVINSLRYESHPSHLNVEEALDIVNFIKQKNTY